MKLQTYPHTPFWMSKVTPDTAFTVIMDLHRDSHTVIGLPQSDSHPEESTEGANIKNPLTASFSRRISSYSLFFNEFPNHTLYNARAIDVLTASQADIQQTALL